MTSGRASASNGTSSAVRIVLAPGASLGVWPATSLCSDPSVGDTEVGVFIGVVARACKPQSGLIVSHLLDIDRA